MTTLVLECLPYHSADLSHLDKKSCTNCNSGIQRGVVEVRTPIVSFKCHERSSQVTRMRDNLQVENPLWKLTVHPNVS